MCKIKGLSGYRFGNLTILEELVDNKLRCLCMICGHVEVYHRAKVVSMNTKCKKCNSEMRKAE